MNYLLNKKTAFIAIIANAIKKFLRTVTGTTSATLTNVNDNQSLVLLELSGASGGSGDKTENLFDKNTITDNHKLVNGVPKDTYSTWFTTDYIDVSGATNVSMTSGASYGFYDVNKTLISWENKSFSIFRDYTVPNNAKYFRVSAEKTNDMINTMMVVKGSYTETTMPTYVPYGYKIGVSSYPSLFDINNCKIAYASTSSKNLYPTSVLNGKVIFGGLAGSNGGGRIVVPVVEGKSYTVKCYYTHSENITNIGGDVSCCETYDEINQVNSTMSYLKSFYSLISSNTLEQTVTIPQGKHYLLFALYGNVKKEVYSDSIQIYESTKTPLQLTTYTGPTPLAQGEKVGVDFENKEAKRKQDLWWFPKSFDAVASGTSTGIVAFDRNQSWESGKYIIHIEFDAKDIVYSSSGNLIYINIANTDGLSTYVGITSSTYMNGYVDITTTKDIDYIVGINRHARWTGGIIKVTNITMKSNAYVDQDLTNLNTNLLNAAQTTFEGTTVITDNSVNKVSGIKCDYYASK